MVELVGRGPRQARLACALRGFISHAGCSVLDAPGNFTAGVMISASPQSYDDHGLKVFGTGASNFRTTNSPVEQEIFRLRQHGRPRPASQALTVERAAGGVIPDFSDHIFRCG